MRVDRLSLSLSPSFLYLEMGAVCLACWNTATLLKVQTQNELFCFRKNICWEYTLKKV